MKKRNLIILTSLVLFSGVLYLLFRGNYGSDISGKTEAPATDLKAPGEITGGASPAVEITAEKQQMIGVKTVEVSVKPLEKVIRAVGRIEYDERKLATVNSKVEGWIEKLHADYTGKYVKKGEPLAEIYSPELFAIQLEYLNLLKWKQEKGHRLQRNLEFRWGDRYGTSGQMLTFDVEALLQVARQRMRFWDITEKQIKEFEKKGEPMRTFTVKSPVNGYIVQKPAVQGKRFEAGEKLFDLADLSTLWVISDVFVYELPLINVGQAAKISLSFFPGQEFSSEVDFIYPLLASETRTARVRFVVPNSGGLLKPQMFTNTEIKIDLGERLVVPEDAVIDTGARKIIYVDKGEGRFEPREVTLGLRTNGMAEVTKGTRAGEKVACAATFLIDSEAKLNGVVQ
ncbi:MAG TPA: efflux RND transporter periplasmic adaptor subunit [Thermodesulfobacteriota bacterium]